MGEHLSVLIYQMEIFGTIMLIGFLAQRIGLLKDEVINGISSVLVRLVLPLMILTKIGGGATRQGLIKMGAFFFISLLVYSIGPMISALSSKVLKIKHPTNDIHTAAAGFGNAGFIGYPIILAMFPEEAPLVIATYILIDTTAIWTIGPMLANPESSGFKFDLKTMISPLTIAVLIGFIMIIFNIKFDNVIWHTMADMGDMSKYLAILYVGADIGRKGVKELTKNLKVFWVVPIRLIIIPVVAYFIINMFNTLTENQTIMLMVLSSTPSVVVLTMLARMYGSDDSYASASVIVTTVACLFTMPFVMWLIAKV